MNGSSGEVRTLLTTCSDHSEVILHKDITLILESTRLRGSDVHNTQTERMTARKLSTSQQVRLTQYLDDELLNVERDVNKR